MLYEGLSPCRFPCRRDACLTLRFQTGNCMLFEEIQTKWRPFILFIQTRFDFLIVYIFLPSTLKIIRSGGQTPFQRHKLIVHHWTVKCRRANITGASSVFSIGSWSQTPHPHMFGPMHTHSVRNVQQPE